MGEGDKWERGLVMDQPGPAQQGSVVVETKRAIIMAWKFCLEFKA